MLGFIPLSAALAYWTPERHIAVFVTSVLAILPLAAYIGRATESLAEQLGGGIGGLLNATFGNAAELIIGALALREGLTDLVKASITGSIIGNLLLVFGASALVGGLKHPVQHFNLYGGRTRNNNAAAEYDRAGRTGGVPPALARDAQLAGAQARYRNRRRPFHYLCLSLVFTLRTHRAIAGMTVEPEAGADAVHTQSKKQSILTLIGATAAVAVVSEVMVGSVEATARDLGFTELFVGVVIIAIIGNAAEHYSAIVMAANNKMDAAISIAVGSSTQIALFVAPALVFLSYVLAPQPMDLLFSVFEIVAISLSVLTIAFIAHDGETHWMEGVQLLAVYIILVLGFFFLPA